MVTKLKTLVLDYKCKVKIQFIAEMVIGYHKQGTEIELLCLTKLRSSKSTKGLNKVHKR